MRLLFPAMMLAAIALSGGSALAQPAPVVLGSIEKLATDIGSIDRDGQEAVAERMKALGSPRSWTGLVDVERPGPGIRKAYGLFTPEGVLDHVAVDVPPAEGVDAASLASALERATGGTRCPWRTGGVEVEFCPSPTVRVSLSREAKGSLFTVVIAPGRPVPPGVGGLDQPGS